MESAGSMERKTVPSQIEGSLVFMDTIERIRILVCVVDTTSHEEGLLGITAPLDKCMYIRNKIDGSESLSLIQPIKGMQNA